MDVPTAAMIKLATTEMECRVVDACLQLFGGYGYMTEYPISRYWTDARIQRIYGGTNEIMKEVIARSLVGRRKTDSTKAAAILSCLRAAIRGQIGRESCRERVCQYG